jgi:hypothetical protein
MLEEFSEIFPKKIKKIPLEAPKTIQEIVLELISSGIYPDAVFVFEDAAYAIIKWHEL